MLAKEKNLDFWLYDEPTLDKILGKFWFEVRQKKGDFYSINSLRSLRHGINRSLKRRGHEFDITKSPSFVSSQGMFEDACQHLKINGKGFVKHYKAIKPKGTNIE